MSDAAAKLLEQAIDLPLEDRREVAERLMESVELEESFPPDPEYLAEIIRRSDEAHAHPDRLIPWDEARKAIRAELARRRAAREAGGAG
ncbi:MAG: addiction module protein [Gemmataceae bacterium]|nr:addiction module protein [Gemmataceae bacterium]